MYKFFKNIEIADKYLLENRSVPAAILDELKNDVSKNNFIGIAQINPIVGALEYNAKILPLFSNNSVNFSFCNRGPKTNIPPS